MADLAQWGEVVGWRSLGAAAAEPGDSGGRRAGRVVWPLLAFFVPVIIHAIAFTAVNVSPFGDRSKSMMVIDNFHQYSPFLLEFRDIIKSGGSLLYSWNDGLGSNYWARYAYYLASPLNLLFALFPARMLPEFIVGLTLLRTGFSGLTFFYFIRKRGVTAHAAMELGDRERAADAAHISDMAAVACGAMYAVSAYTLAYYWNIMWFDCIALLPLVALGIRRLAEGRGGAPYCLALAAVMYTNYYIALIVCVFSALWFVACRAARSRPADYALLAAPKRLALRGHAYTTARFAGWSLLAAALAAVILLPTWSALSVSQSAGARFPGRWEFYYNALEILYGHLFNVTPSVMSGRPNLYCGVAALLLIPLYFANRLIPTREKAAYGALLAFMLLSCNVNILNFIWHGLHFPNSLPYRFTFLYIFVAAALCHRALCNLGGVRRGAAWRTFAAAALCVLAAEKLVPDLSATGVTYPSLLFLGLYAAAIELAIWRRAADGETGRGARRARTVAAAFALLISTELAVNAGLGIGAAGIGERDNYVSDLDAVRGAVAGVMAASDTSSASPPSSGYNIYRAEFLKDTVSNTPSLYGYRGASYFSSTAVLKFTDLMGKLGLRPSSAWYIYKGNTPVVNSLFALRWLMSKEDVYDHPLYPKAGQKNGVTVYENPYALPLGFFAHGDTQLWSVKQNNVFTVQNDFLRLAAGLDKDWPGALTPAAVRHKESRNAELTGQSGSLYHFKVTDAGEPGFINFTVPGGPRDAAVADRTRPLYLYVNSRDVDYVWYIKGERSEGHDPKYYPYIIDTQYFGDTDEIEISLKFEESDAGDFELYASYLDTGAFLEAYEALAARPFMIDTFTETRVSGTIRADEPGLLFTSIPYDGGWSARLDGRALRPDEILRVGEGFLAVRVRSGDHRVEFSYAPQNFMAGLCVSLAAALLVILISFAGVHKKMTYAH